MVAKQGGLFEVRFRDLDLLVPNVAIICRKDSSVSQQLNALFHPWELFCIPYGHGVELSVLRTKTHFSIFGASTTGHAHFDIACSNRLILSFRQPLERFAPFFIRAQYECCKDKRESEFTSM